MSDITNEAIQPFKEAMDGGDSVQSTLNILIEQRQQARDSAQLVVDGLKQALQALNAMDVANDTAVLLAELAGQRLTNANMILFAHVGLDQSTRPEAEAVRGAMQRADASVIAAGGQVGMVHLMSADLRADLHELITSSEEIATVLSDDPQVPSADAALRTIGPETSQLVQTWSDSI
jgi:hypothetical protein